MNKIGKNSLLSESYINDAVQEAKSGNTSPVTTDKHGEKSQVPFGGGSLKQVGVHNDYTRMKENMTPEDGSTLPSLLSHAESESDYGKVYHMGGETTNTLRQPLIMGSEPRKGPSKFKNPIEESGVGNYTPPTQTQTQTQTQTSERQEAPPVPSFPPTNE
ncbi:MAG: hypothetical protein ACOYK6_06315 [Chthoniobacterales bacterium]